MRSSIRLSRYGRFGVCGLHKHLAIDSTSSEPNAQTAVEPFAIPIPQPPAVSSAQGPKSENQLDRSLRTGSVVPLLGHNFDQLTARSLPFSLYTGVMPALMRMQQLLIDGLNPAVRT